MSNHVLILLCHLVTLYTQISFTAFLENYFKRILVLKGIFWEINTLVCNFFLCHIFILSHLPLSPILFPLSTVIFYQHSLNPSSQIFTFLFPWGISGCSSRKLYPTFISFTFPCLLYKLPRDNYMIRK